MVEPESSAPSGPAASLGRGAFRQRSKAARRNGGSPISQRALGQALGQAKPRPSLLHLLVIDSPSPVPGEGGDTSRFARQLVLC